MSINYANEFISRTKEVVDMGFATMERGGREFTFLMNCLLGLVIAVSQREDDKDRGRLNVLKNSFLEGDVDQDFLDVLGIAGKTNFLNQSKISLISNIRHGIAHQHIEATIGDANENVWRGVRIWNNYRGNEFTIEFTKEELKSFATTLAHKYNMAEQWTN